MLNDKDNKHATSITDYLSRLRNNYFTDSDSGDQDPKIYPDLGVCEDFGTWIHQTKHLDHLEKEYKKKFDVLPYLSIQRCPKIDVANGLVTYSSDERVENSV